MSHHPRRLAATHSFRQKHSRRPRIERLEIRNLLTASSGGVDAASLLSGTICNCPVCTGENLPSGGELVTYEGPAASLPVLSSNPGATAKLYLDFDGDFQATWGSYSNVTTPPYDIDGNPSAFSATELANVQAIWARVAEDYAPFNIDVTTIAPGSLANKVVAHIAIGGDGAWYGPSGGVAYVGGFYNSAPNVGYVFPDNLSNGFPKYVADAASHEAGHLFGLLHQSVYSGTTKTKEYNPGTSAVAPLMGNSYSAARSTWHYGTSSTSSTSYQDDIALLNSSNNGFGSKSDDFGSTIATASPLPVSGTSVNFAGLLGHHTDQDVWEFSTIGGAVSLALNGASVGTNLDAILDLRNSSGGLVISSNPSNSLNASISTTLGSGTYYVIARSDGTYGNMGQYTVSGTLPANAPATIELVNKTTSIREDADTSAGIKVADIVITDDNLGTNILSIEGTHREMFELRNNGSNQKELWLVPGAVLDFETLPTLNVTVEVEDDTIPGEPDDSDSLAISIEDVNESPTGLELSENSVQENQAAGTEVGTFSTTDPDAGSTSFTYTLVAGSGDADNAAFTIVDGVLKTDASFDFETQSSYSIRVRTTDGGGLFFERAFTISVLDVNEAPSLLLQNTTLALLENRDTSTRIKVADIVIVDDALGSNSLSLTGADASLFEIDSGVLYLRAGVALDHETKPTLNVTVAVDDSSVGSSPDDTASLAISIDNVNEAPTALLLSNSTVDENRAAGSPVGTFNTTDPDVGDTFTYTLVTGDGDGDNGSFEIVDGELRTTEVFDHEAKSSYSIRVQTEDAGGLTLQAIFVIGVNDINEAPTAVLLSAASVPENEDAGTVVGTLSSSDPDAGESFVYTLVAGDGSADNASFEIVNGELRTKAEFDFEAKSSYTIRVRTTDSGGLSFEKAFTITIIDVNEAPTDLALSGNSVDENEDVGTVVGTLSSSDPDAGESFVYTLVAGDGSADNGSFEIVNGELRTKAEFDFEAKSSYTIRVRTTDSGGLSFEKAFTITIVDVNEAPTDLALSGNSVNENEDVGTVVGTLSSSDPDAGESFVYTLVAGDGSADNGSFEIVNGELRTTAEFNHEAKDSYTIRVRTTDSGGLSFEKAFTITIVDVNEAPTDLALSGNSVNENEDVGTVIGTLSSSDPDAGESFVYTLVAGAGSADNGSFEIVNGELRTKAEFDFEAKSSYTIRVRTTDSGGLSFEKAFTISIVDVNEAPTDLTLSNDTVDESAAIGSVVGTLTTVDPDAGDEFTYELTPGTGSDDNAAFTVDAETGIVRTAVTFDFNTQSTYFIRVRSTDSGGLTIERSFTIFIDNVNDAPTDLTLSGSDIDENLAAGTLVGVFTTTDPDTGDSFVYQLVTGEGDADNASFAVDETTGELTTAASFDHEAKSSYQIRVRTTDASGLSYEKAFVITVNDVNETPTDVLLSVNSVDENRPAGTLVGILSTLDPDADETFSYELVGGDGSGDNGAFQVDETSGELTTAASFDFETKSGYSIRVRTTDSGGLWIEKIFAISINDINEAPTDLALSGTSVAENQPDGTTVGTFSALDPDAGDALEFSLVAGGGDDDNGSFQIVDGVLQTTASFDYEAKNSYTIRVRATDAGGLSTEGSFTITINDVNEAPQISLTPIVTSLADNTDTSATIRVADIVIADDALGSRTIWLSGPDASKFKIIGSGLYLRAGTVLDAGTNPSLDVTIYINDPAVGGSPDDSDSLSIAVTDAGNAPTALTLSANQVAENLPAGTVVGTLTSSDPDADDTFTYTLVSGAGDANNDAFAVDAESGVLTTAISFDFETKSSYSIRVRTTDAAGLTFERSFTIQVTDVNDAPQISLANQLPELSEDADTSVAIEVADIVITDDALGSKTYYILGGLNDDASLFEIDGATGKLRLRAGTTLNHGLKPELSVTIVVDDPALGSSWEDSVTFVLAITEAGESSPTESTGINEGDADADLNHAPVLNNAVSPALTTIKEDAVNPAGTRVASLLAGVVTDPDAGALAGIAVTGASSFNGIWQFSLDGSTWMAMGTVSTHAALLLPGSAWARFIPKADFNGQVGLWYRAWDQTQGSPGQKLSTEGNCGGDKSMSLAVAGAKLRVTAVNDRPVISFYGTIGYRRDKPAIVLAPYARLTDVDSPNFAGGRLKIYIGSGASSSNRLAIGASFTIDAANNVRRDGKIIGKRNANGGQGTEELIVTFNSSATQAVVKELLRSITFKTVGGTAGLRQAVFSVSDGDGGTSLDITKKINVI